MDTDLKNLSEEELKKIKKKTPTTKTQEGVFTL